MITIKSKKEGFRRCGIRHPVETVEYLDGRFTEAELKILQAEPMLLVEVVPGPKPAPDVKPAKQSDTVASVEEPIKPAKKDKK